MFLKYSVYNFFISSETPGNLSWLTNASVIPPISLLVCLPSTTFCNSDEITDIFSVVLRSDEARLPCLKYSGIFSSSFEACSSSWFGLILVNWFNSLSSGFLSICQSFGFDCDPIIVYGILSI